MCLGCRRHALAGRAQGGPAAPGGARAARVAGFSEPSVLEEAGVRVPVSVSCFSSFPPNPTFGSSGVFRSRLYSRGKSRAKELISWTSFLSSSRHFIFAKRSLSVMSCSCRWICKSFRSDRKSSVSLHKMELSNLNFQESNQRKQSFSFSSV